MYNNLIKKTFIFGIMVLLISMSITITPGRIVEKSSSKFFENNTLYVGGTGPGNYTTIQDAIDDAVDGDTVYVYDDSSPYELSKYISIEKSINLIGENRDTTIITGSIEFIDGLPKTDVIIFITNTDWVNVSGFTIKDSERSGITVYMCDNVNISGNIFLNHKFVSIGFIGGNYSYIYDNIITSTKADDLIKEGGIYLEFVSFTTIIGNIFTNCFVGITLTCYFFEAPFDPIGNIISNNLFDNNNVALEIKANNTLITSNTISNHTGPTNLIIPALSLKGCNNTITCNNFINNIRDANNVQYTFASQKIQKNRNNKNIWDGNYWGRPRFLPKFIFSYHRYERKPPEPSILFPGICFDMHPAKELNKI